MPISAATKYDNEVFVTPVHGLEEDAARAKLGPERFNNANVVHGFVTKSGEFLTREQAAVRAKMADPTYKQNWMDSNDLRPADYNTRNGLDR